MIVFDWEWLFDKKLEKFDFLCMNCDLISKNSYVIQAYV